MPRKARKMPGNARKCPEMPENFINICSYDEVRDYLEGLANDHPEFVNMTVEAKTAENRNLMLLKIGTSPKGSETPAIWIDAGIDITTHKLIQIVL